MQGKLGYFPKLVIRVWDQFANGWDFTQREVAIWRALEDYKWSEVKSLSRVRLFATPWTVAY